jgi:hypothetical protein
MTEFIRDTSGALINGFSLKSGETLTIRVYSATGATSCFINACRSDFMESSPTGETAATALLHGQGLIDADAIEARIPPAAFASICGFAKALDLGAIAANNYVTVELRTTIGAGVASFGLAIRAN